MSYTIWFDAKTHEPVRQLVPAEPDPSLYYSMELVDPDEVESECCPDCADDHFSEGYERGKAEGRQEAQQDAPKVDLDDVHAAVADARFYVDEMESNLRQLTDQLDTIKECAEEAVPVT